MVKQDCLDIYRLFANTVYTAETQSAGACTSTNKYGSISLGVAIKKAEYTTLRAVGMIWPPPKPDNMFKDDSKCNQISIKTYNTF